MAFENRAENTSKSARYSDDFGILILGRSDIQARTICFNPQVGYPLYDIVLIQLSPVVSCELFPA